MKKLIAVILSTISTLSLAVSVSATNTETSYFTVNQTPIYYANDTMNYEPAGYLSGGIKFYINSYKTEGCKDYVYFTASDGMEYKVREDSVIYESNFDIESYKDGIANVGDQVMNDILNGKATTIDIGDYIFNDYKHINFHNEIERYINIRYYCKSLDSALPKLVVSNDGIIDVAKSRTNYYKSTYIPGKIVKDLNLEGKSELQKIYAIEDYICSLMNYDKTLLHNGAIECLYTGKGVCQDYAETFQVLCQEAGIKSVEVLGIVPEGFHAWNRVCIDGKWYGVDVCFYDSKNLPEKTRNIYKLFDDSDRTCVSIISEI